MQQRVYIPALGYEPLTALYDPVLRLTMREAYLKRRLVQQADLRPGMRVLDVGCGTGTLTLLARQTQPESDITGLDGDAAMLGRAQRKAERSGVAVTFAQGFSYALPYPDHSFDRVVSSLLFHHLTTEDKRHTLYEIHRVLRPGGELHIADWGKAQNLVMRGAFLLIQLLDGFITTADHVTGKLPAYIIAAGLKDVQQTAQFATMFGTLTLYRAQK